MERISACVLRVCLAASGMSLQDLADALQLSRSAIANWSSGYDRVPQARTAELLTVFRAHGVIVAASGSKVTVTFDAD